jgi:hypothetical protein
MTLNARPILCKMHDLVFDITYDLIPARIFEADEAYANARSLSC